ncbi:MAG TPA: hypothetical protein DCZ95_04785 [Verrucomicrobia bacterium]|nr:hypothetical protein [Verrucomicrobiota bacterium]
MRYYGVVWAVFWLGSGLAFGEDFPGLLRDMVWVPGGVFRMGSPESESSPIRDHCQVPAFWMGRHEVTVEEYAAFLNDAGRTNSMLCNDLSLRAGRYRPRWFRARRPVSGVSFADATAYGDWLSRKTGWPVRLPTEMEWEYAARGGIAKARYPWGWGEPAERACFDESSARRVGAYEPNPFGLYDMAGNVFEWCRAEGDRPAGQALARGGSWAEWDARCLRVFHRIWFPETYRDADVGFRIMIPAP